MQWMRRAGNEDAPRSAYNRCGRVKTVTSIRGGGAISSETTSDSVPDTENAPDLMNRSVLRAMALLNEIGNFPDGATASELAIATGLARPTVFRLLLSMTHAGFLVKTDGTFTLGWQVARLGRIAHPHSGVLPRIQVFIDSLVADLNETIGYAVVTGPTTVELISEATGSHVLSPALGYLGKEFPLHASATGKILLANLDNEQLNTLLPEELAVLTRFTIARRSDLMLQLTEIRSLGYATIDNELEEGLYSLAVPVRDVTGHLIGVLSVSGLDQRMKSASIYGFVERLQTAATEISTVLSSTIQ